MSSAGEYHPCVALGPLSLASNPPQLYRFAAVEFVPPEYQSTAIAIVLSGGVVGAVVGPEYSKRTKSAIPEHQFVGCFLASMGIYALNLVLILIIRFPSGAPFRGKCAIDPNGKASWARWTMKCV